MGVDPRLFPPHIRKLIEASGIAPEEKKRSKYNNNKITDEQHGKFDSEHEYGCFRILLQRQSAGHVRNLKRQVKFYFGEGGRFVCYDNGRKMAYYADFEFEEISDDGRWYPVVADAKGHVTKEYNMKKALMRYFHGIEIREL
ncbi:MAG: DUF1064 domain-containing protein [Candidatus Binatia bacterium]